MGVAVLATVFSAHGSYASPQAFSDGVVAALPIAGAVLAMGAVMALFVPGIRSRGAVHRSPEAEGAPAAAVAGPAAAGGLVAEAVS